MSPQEIGALLGERLQQEIPPQLAEQLATYLQLLLLWNSKTNLSAIRAPEDIVVRHFGESLECAQAIPAAARTLLDYGSGAGFPGALCALVRPDVRVTLAEAQGKKAAFLRELCRSLPLAARVHAGRVEELDALAAFDVVTLRAVDRMGEACGVASSRLNAGGRLLAMTTAEGAAGLAGLLPELRWEPPTPMRISRNGVLACGQAL